MNVKMTFKEKELTAQLFGEIDHHTASDIREQIDYEVEKYKPTLLKLDFSKIKFMDSSGIGLIMGRYRLMSMVKGKLQIINIPDHLKRIIALSGVTGLGILGDAN